MHVLLAPVRPRVACTTSAPSCPPFSLCTSAVDHVLWGQLLKTEPALHRNNAPTHNGMLHVSSHSELTHASFFFCTDVLVATLRGDGCVLIPCDSAGRLLELALLLDEFWAQEK